MREIDTEAPVVWPAWCYSGNTDESTIEVITRKGELDSDIVRQISNSTTETSGKARIRNRSTNARRQARNTTAFQEGTYTEKVHYNNQDGGAQLAIPPPYSLNKTLLVDKMLSDRMLVGFNVDNNKKHCDSNPSNILFDKVKNEAQMDPAKNGELGNNNNNNNSSSNNNNNNNSSSNNNNNNGSSSNNSSSSIKRERLSPPTNGDVQSSISRSRSATPSSFPGTPPQPAHPNDLSGSSLSANILSSVQARSNEFQTRNYSDFMRSLAAKYNNNNPNDSSVQRNMLFEAKYAASKSSIKESPSPPENKRQNMPNFNPPQVANVPFVSSLLSSLPFPPAVFPPVFDMSSTQALVTLARAAKEAEIQSIIKTAQKRPAAVQSVSPSSRTSHTPTPQPAASSSSVRQFSPQPFVLPGQFHQQTIQPRQPSPLSTPVSSQSTDTVPASPLDLSATQQTKRVKLEDPSSPSSSPKRDSSLHRKSPKMEIAADHKDVSTTPIRHCQAQSEEVNCWTVDDVCEFVGSIDICAEYAKNFREQCIDGSGLPLLTEDHLTNSLGMKLGPALKLRSILAKKLGGPCPCVSCTIITQQQQSQHLVASATASSSTVIPSSNSSSTSSSSSLVNIISQQQGGYTASSNQSSSCSNIPRPTSTDSGS